MIAWLGPNTPFPPLENALDEPNGLLAAGGDLSPRRLIQAYRNGVFPWYSEGQPILWWSPNPRMVLYVSEFRASRSLRRRTRQATFDIRVDTAFETVMMSCATVPRAGQFGTWITAPMIDAYVNLHSVGYAHSVEAWQGDALVGGLYGLSLGRVFFGESMFALQPDASKVALAGLISVLERQGVPLIDCQQSTPHLASLGGRVIPRSRFAAHLSELIDSVDPPGNWPKGPLRRE